MIDTLLLRELGSKQPAPDIKVLQEACLQAADTIEELCTSIDGCVRVAVDALKRAKP